MASPLVELIIRIRGMVATGKCATEIDPYFATLTERTEAIESDLLAIKAEAEDTTLETERDNLKAEAQAIQAALEQAMEEIKRLRADAGERDWHNGEHDKQIVKVMEYLAEHSDAPHCGMRAEVGIALMFNFGTELTKHYLDILLERKWAYNAAEILGETDYRLTAEGRGFLAARGLLK
jgi:molybdopterin converting factor small subunit